MEDPSEEYWEVDDYSQPYDSKGKLGCIWRKGLKIGKKMVVTGVIISSAPFFLPPLVALSALGVAFSVPAGFAVVTYACSEKLMNKLLPMPSPDPWVEDGMGFANEEEDWYYRYHVGKGYEEDEDMDAEEGEFDNYIRKEVEIRFDLVEDGYGKIDDYDQMPVNEIVEEEGYEEDHNIDAEERELENDKREEIEMRIELAEEVSGKIDDYDRTRVNEIVEEEGYEEHQYMDAEERELEYHTRTEVETMIDFLESNCKIDDYNRAPVNEIVEEEGYGEDQDMVAEDREFENETRRKEIEMSIELAEEVDGKIDDYDRTRVNETVEEEGYEENQDINAEESEFENDTRKKVEMRIEFSDEVNCKIDDYDQTHVKEIVDEEGYEEDAGEYMENEEKTLNISGIGEEEMRRETTGLLEEMRDEDKEDQGRQDTSVEETTKENKEMSEIPIKDETQKKEDNNLLIIPEEVKPSEDEKGLANIESRYDDAQSNLSSVANEVTNEEVCEKKSQRDNGVAVQDEPKTEVQQKVELQVKTSSNHTASDVRLETCSDGKKETLVIPDADARQIADESGLHLVDHRTPSTDQTGDSASKMSEGAHQEAPIELTLPVSKQAEIKSGRDTTASSGKVTPSEERIWEQIQAMRTIVGYKATPHSSCAEELRALYIFTGVELQASCKDSSDLIDIDEKLHFLMSIVGVK